MKPSRRYSPCAIVLGASLLSVPQAVMAKAGEYYALAAIGYALNEVETKVDSNASKYEVEELSYKVSVGYELSKHWAIEAGVHILGDTDIDNSELVFDNPDFKQRDYSLQAIQVSALGKAGNQHGELFYRIGVLQIKPEATYVTQEAQCMGSDRVVTSPNATSLVSVCQNDDSFLAGVVGLGFDFYVNESLLLRTEVEYIQGEQGYSSKGIYLGFKYNF